MHWSPCSSTVKVLPLSKLHKQHKHVQCHRPCHNGSFDQWDTRIAKFREGQTAQETPWRFLISFTNNLLKITDYLSSYNSSFKPLNQDDAKTHYTKQQQAIGWQSSPMYWSSQRQCSTYTQSEHTCKTPYMKCFGRSVISLKYSIKEVSCQRT